MTAKWVRQCLRNPVVSNVMLDRVESMGLQILRWKNLKANRLWFFGAFAQNQSIMALCAKMLKLVYTRTNQEVMHKGLLVHCPENEGDDPAASLT
eukprot:3917609-Amphidinium_carterae.1